MTITAKGQIVPLPQMTEQLTANSRHTDRLPVRRTVQVTTSDGRELSVLCTDVNLSGIGIDSDRVLHVGQRLSLQITSRDGAISQVPMLVIYRMGQHYGLSALASLENVLELLPLDS